MCLFGIPQCDEQMRYVLVYMRSSHCPVSCNGNLGRLSSLQSAMIVLCDVDILQGAQFAG